tara:strand:+ start:319 stop:1437 length:1119 start_codon:yes stop_codon:yes gene_type:complete
MAVLLSILVSAAIFLLVIFFLVLVHEWGHFIVAKKTGMRVDEFAIGFPPKIFGIKKGETEYTFNWLPIGGFVRIFGENGEDKLTGADHNADSRSFNSRPRWAQALVLIAGVVMNVITAWFLFSIVLMMGVPTEVEESLATAEADLYVTGVLPDSPAASLPVGSVITQVSSGDVTINDPLPSEFSKIVVEAGAEPLTISYEVGGETAKVDLVAEQGLIEDEPDRFAIGVAYALVEMESLPVHQAVVGAIGVTYDRLGEVVVGFGSLVSDMFVGEADLSNVAGPIGIGAMVDDVASLGLASLLTFTAIISLNLAVINLLPFPALDGGRLLFVLIEAITRRDIPPVWAGRLNLIGFALLMVLMIVVTVNDILRLT